jgi:nucleotide-binding universal stress UspA family protein
MGPLPPAEFDADVRNEAQLMVDDVVAAHPDLCTRVPVTVDAVNGSPAEVLLWASQDADLLVLGHRGRGGFSSVLLGSVGLQCVLRAVCAVTIVRPVVARAEPDAVRPGASAAPAPV